MYTSAASCFLHLKKMQENFEQRYTLKFCVKLGKTAKENKDMLQPVYVDSLASMPTFYHWYNAFRDGRESVVDEPQEGQPGTAHNETSQNTMAVVV